MEIADIFVVNKADRDGPTATVASIEAMLSLQTFEAGQWRPPIVKTEATTGKGVAELLSAVERFRAHSAGAARRTPPGAGRVAGARTAVAPASCSTSSGRVLDAGRVRREFSIASPRARLDPYTAVDEIMRRALRQAVE